MSGMPASGMRDARVGRWIEEAQRDGAGFPLSFAQDRLWFLHQFDPSSPAYNVVGAFRLDGALDLQLFSSCLRELVDRHETLRTVFAAPDGTPLQIILPSDEIPVTVVDLSSGDLLERNRELDALIAREARRPFDLSRGPLLRVHLVRTGAGEHVLLAVLHHIICDDWSIGILVREFAELYARAERGDAAPLPELPIQYADFAAWQKETLTDAALAEHGAYWRRQFATLPPVLELPTDMLRPTGRTFHGGTVERRFSASLGDELARFARQEETTPFAVLLAACGALLRRYTGEADVVIGSPFASRDRLEIEGLIGFFVNMLALRTVMPVTATFREAVRHARTTVLDAYQHHAFPFERLVEDVRPERDLNHAPLFQVTLSLQTDDVDRLRVGSLTAERLSLEAGTAVFDLNLFVTLREGRLGATLRYNADIFLRETVERLLGHFETLLASSLRDPDRQVAYLPLLTSPEADDMLRRWNDTATPFEGPQTIHELFEAQVTRTPDAPAVIAADAVWSYATLNRRANRLAHHLRDLGVRADQPVAIVLERTPAMIQAIFGVLKAGGAYVPLDPAFPPARVQAMLADSGARVLVTDSRHAPEFEQFPGAIVRLDADASLLGSRPVTNPRSEAGPGNLIYVIYTSGSTGTPKGVMLPHGGIRNRLLAMQQEYGLTLDDRILQKTTFSFDVSVWEIFWPLLNGASTVLAAPGVERDPPALLETIQRHRVTMLHFVPPMLQACLEEPSFERCLSLKNVVCGGELLPLELQQRFFRRSSAQLHNHYGPTEGSVEVTRWTCPRDGERSNAPIGRPLANVRIYVLSPQLEPVPIGVPGELCFGGIALARGYLGRPDLTAERFIPDPWRPTPGGRLYRTGDLVRYLPTGEIEFLGRNDHQVKIRGFRIELGEVQSVVLRHDDVADAVVMAVVDPVSRAKRLAAFVVATAGRPLDADAVRAFTRERLPEYMVPEFVILPSLPLTSTGKIDRLALQSMDLSAVRAERAVADEPSTPTERALAEIWGRVLGVAGVGRDDNFFDLGGYSLVATQVVSRVRQELRVAVALRELFEAPTLAELARVVDGHLAAQRSIPAPAPVAATATEPDQSALSPAQERLWIVEHLLPGTPAYTLACALRLSGRLDVTAVERAFSAIVSRHEVLRTVFPSVDGAPSARLLPEAAIGIDVEGLSAGSTVDDWLKPLATLPFDVEIGPLVRIRLLRVAPEEHVLLVTVHHLLADEWSVRILVDEFATLYEAAASGRPVMLPPVLQYRDVARRQRARLDAATLDGDVGFWKEALGPGAPPVLHFPADVLRPALRSGLSGLIQRGVAGDVARRARRLGAELRMTPFTMLLAAVAAFVYRYTGQMSFVIGTPVANRPEPELETAVGFFANTMVIRCDLDREMTFLDLVSRVRDRVVAGLEHASLPFERLVDAIGPERALDRAPLFQIMFTVEDGPFESLRLPGLTATPIDVHAGGAKFDLSMRMIDRPGALSAVLEYDRDLFSDSTGERLLDGALYLLDQLTAQPAVAIGDLPLMPPDEQERLLARGRGVARAITEMLPAQLARVAITHGARPAVVDNGVVMTYAELDMRATRVARSLRRRGIAPDAVVGVCAPRSAAVVVAILGTMKAGAAYLPIDPEIPAARSRALTADAGVRLVLTLTPDEDRFACPSACIDDLLAAGDGDGESVAAVEPDSLAYAIATSGSTGVPKTIGVTHRALANHMAWILDHLGIAGGDAVLQRTPLTFDASVWELFAPLLAGGRLVLASPKRDVEPDYLASTIAVEQITILQLVPSLAQALVDVLPGKSLECLRYVCCGGEPLASGLAKRIVERWGVKCLNLYGPAECAIDVTAGTFTAASDRPFVAIGSAIANVATYVLDSALRPAAAGLPGELVIGGAAVGRGYLGRPELTAERFVPDPFSPTAGARMYRTGDRARLLPDGQLEFLGRLDAQVKLRGIRVEPEEIEVVLRQYPDVDDAAVVVRDGRVYALICANRVPSAAAIRAFVLERLPHYMAPASRDIHLVSRLPMTAHGKRDRRALEPLLPPREAAVVLPADSPLVAAVTSAFVEALGVSVAAPDDQFFDLGGHSLAALQLASRLRRALDVELSPRDIFENPTIAELTLAVERRLLERLTPDEAARIIDEVAPRAGEWA